MDFKLLKVRCAVVCGFPVFKFAAHVVSAVCGRPYVVGPHTVQTAHSETHPKCGGHNGETAHHSEP